MRPIPLSEEDRAILELEGPTVAGHTCKVVELQAPGVELGALRAHVEQRLAGEPLLRARLGGESSAPAWVADPDFAVDRQVTELQGAPVPAGELHAVVAEVFERRLDRDRPLWRIDVARLAGGGAALIWRLHHALADGTAAMRFAREILWDDVEASAPPAAAPAAHPAAAAGAPGPGADEQHERRRGHLAAFLEREFAESLRRSPFDGEVGARRSVAFATVPFAPLHDAAKRLGGATINDAVLTIVAGGLRHWTEAHHGSLHGTRFRVPVSLHNEGDEAGNRDSFFTLPVDLEEPDPVERLRAIHASEQARKEGHDAERLESLLAKLRSHLPPLAALAERVEASPRSFALCVSNIPGPRADRTVLGTPVRALHTLAEVGCRHGLRVAVVSYAGDLFFGLLADPAIADDLGAMAAGIEAEAEALVAAR